MAPLTVDLCQFSKMRRLARNRHPRARRAPDALQRNPSQPGLTKNPFRRYAGMYSVAVCDAAAWLINGGFMTLSAGNRELVLKNYRGRLLCCYGSPLLFDILLQPSVWGSSVSYSSVWIPSELCPLAESLF